MAALTRIRPDRRGPRHRRRCAAAAIGIGVRGRGEGEDTREINREGGVLRGDARERIASFILIKVDNPDGRRAFRTDKTLFLIAGIVRDRGPTNYSRVRRFAADFLSSGADALQGLLDCSGCWPSVFR